MRFEAIVKQVKTSIDASGDKMTRITLEVAGDAKGLTDLMGDQTVQVEVVPSA